MSESATVVTVDAEPSASFDWSTIIGGALIASALSFVLISFGTAAGVASISPYSWNNPSATALSFIAVAWFCVVMIGSFLVGGYFSGRFRRPVETSSSEREARDGAHGLVVWALSLMIGLGIAFCIASLTSRGAASVVSGTVATATQAANQSGATNALIDRMLRPATRDPNVPTRSENATAEIARILNDGALRSGSIPNEDRDHIAAIVSASAHIPQDEARKRVDSTIENAKQTVDNARKIASALAFLIGALSVVSAGAAYWAATAGGRQRDRET